MLCFVFFDVIIALYVTHFIVIVIDVQRTYVEIIVDFTYWLKLFDVFLLPRRYS